MGRGKRSAELCPWEVHCHYDLIVRDIGKPPKHRWVYCCLLGNSEIVKKKQKNAIQVQSLKLTASLHLQIDGWKINFLFGMPSFQGRTVSFSEGTSNLVEFGALTEWGDREASIFVWDMLLFLNSWWVFLQNNTKSYIKKRGILPRSYGFSLKTLRIPITKGYFNQYSVP